ncbi:MAG: hypothetical protein P8M49_13140, partial [Thalassotalea sp.]|nr:hypothetical protein [Thalassotalea sp.]
MLTIKEKIKITSSLLITTAMLSACAPESSTTTSNIKNKTRFDPLESISTKNMLYYVPLKRST